MMKILHVNDNRWALGGVERHLARLAQALAAPAGPTMLLAYGRPAPDDAPDLPLAQEAFVPELSPPYAHDSSAAARALLTLARRFGANSICFHNYIDAHVIERVATEIPVSTFVHVHNAFCPTGTKYLRFEGCVCPRQRGVGCLAQIALRGCGSRRPDAVLRVARQILRTGDPASAAHHVITASTFMRDEVIRAGIAPQHVSVAPLFLTDREIPSRVIDASAEGEMPIVLAPMRVTPEKGAALLPAVAGRLEGRAELWVAGAGHYDAALRAQAGPNLRLLGSCTDEQMQQLYRRAAVVIMPSLWPEPFGIVGLEAMAHAKPVVAFARGGILDWLVPDETGLLVREGTADVLATSVLSLLDDPAFGIRLGAAGRSRVLSLFTGAAHLRAFDHAMHAAQIAYAERNRRPMHLRGIA